MSQIDKKQVVDLLNRILESELAGVIRYTHYSFLVYGYNRIPIVSWLREQAAESQTHAQLAGEMITLAVRAFGSNLYPRSRRRPPTPSPSESSVRTQVQTSFERSGA